MITQKAFTLYNLVTGRIIKSLAAEFEDDDGGNFAALEGAEYKLENGREFYVDVATGDVIARPDGATTIDKTTITADGVDVAVISNIPDPSEVEIRSGIGVQLKTVTDGFLNITAEEADTIVVLVSGVFPIKDKLHEVTAL